METVKRYSLSHQVCDQLEDMIASGEYKIGDKIPTEIELMQLFNVSRNTIREAINALNSMGVLEVRQGDGTYVRSDNRFDANMSQKYEQVNMSDILETREALEIVIAQLAAVRRSSDDLNLIHHKLITRKSCPDNIKENTISDIEFHMAIAKSCHNKILFDLYRSIFVFLENQISEVSKESGFDSNKIDALHDELYNAIREGNPEKAKQCVQAILKTR